MNQVLYSSVIVILVCLILFATMRYKKVRIDFRLLILYIAVTAMLGPLGEVFIGSIYAFFFSEPLWQYQVAPIHHGYTSLIAPLIWGVSGVVLFATREVLKLKRSAPAYYQAFFIMAETIAFEVVLNLIHLTIQGVLLFRYTPGDLWHVTSLQTLPLYYLLGFVFVKAMKRFSSDIKFFTLMCLTVTIVFVYLQ